MNPKLEAIAREAARRLVNSITEREGRILDAWDRVVEQAQEDDKNPVLTLSFALKLDLSRNALVTSLAYSVREKLEIAGEVPDPNQLELPTPDRPLATIKSDDEPQHAYGVPQQPNPQRKARR